MMRKQKLLVLPHIVHDSMGLLSLDLESATATNGKRVYTTPAGKQYPSVTTVLSVMSGDWVTAWKERVGVEEANLVSGRATRRGTKIHSLFEQYLNGQSIDLNTLMPDIKELLVASVPILGSINKVVMQESALYSDALRIAGRFDLLGEWNGRLSIIDFKTSGRLKEMADLEGYFAQCACYALMMKECYDVAVDDIVVIVAVEGEKPQVFEEKAGDHTSYLFTAIERYWKNEAQETNSEAASTPTQ